MMRSLYAGVSGLQAHQTRMDVISNNVANVNTNGFKYSRVTFAETFAQTIKSAVAPGASGGSNPQQVGLGTQVASIDKIFSQGSLSLTGRVTDLAIQGNGFFVLGDKAGTGGRAYGRDGNFVIDGDGYLVTASGGNVVQGWQADDKGVINNAKPLGNIRMPLNGSVPARATTEMKIAGNFSSPSSLNESTAAANFFSTPRPAALPGAGPTNLNPGDLMINDVSITGSIVHTGDAIKDLRQLADLINNKTAQSNVFASVKNTAAGPQLMITSNRIGPHSEIKLASTTTPASLGALGLPTTLPQTTTIYAQVTGNAVPAGQISLVSGDVIVNGVDLGPLTTAQATNTPEQNAQAVAALYNAKSALTGVKAETDGNGRVILKGAARDIVITGTAGAVNAGPPPTAMGGTAATGFDCTTGTHNVARTATTIAGTSMVIYDAQGEKHTVNINYAADYDINRDGAGNITGTRLDGKWAWAGFSTDPNMIVNSQDQNGNHTEHLLQFDNKGILKGFSNGTLTVSYTNSNSSPPPQTISLNAGTIGTTDAVTQFGGITSVDGNGQDGYPAGELVNFGIERNGTLTGIYTNGVTIPVAQLAMATFANPEGLYSAGDTSQVRGAANAYSESPNSGPARIGVANTGNRGEIRGGSLELSNVDLSMQFTDMIITQRGFQANSRSITTSDEMLHELLNLKR